MRRARYGVLTLALLAASTVACVGAIALGDRHRVRIDLTSMRDHSLSERTRAILAGLDTPCEIVVVVGAAAVGPRSRQIVGDLLDAFERANDNIAATWIDSSTQGGLEAFHDLTRRLAGSRAETVATHELAIGGAIDAAQRAGADLAALAQRADGHRDALPVDDARREQMGVIGAALRIRAEEVGVHAAQAQERAAVRIGEIRVPDAPAARRALAPALRSTAEDLATIANWLTQAARADGRDEATDGFLALARAVGEIRDASLVGVDTLDRLPPLDLLGVVRLLERDNAVLMLTPDNATGVHFASLFPATEAVEGAGAQAEALFAGEELIATAIGALIDPHSPIVVLVHGADEPQLDEFGAPRSPDAQQMLGSLFERMRLRRHDVREWAANVTSDRPTLRDIDPDGRRPVVWVVMPAGAAVQDGGAARARRVAAALRSLIEGGESVLVSLEPSTLPRVGEPDPMAAPLLALGLEADSGRPLMQRINTERGVIVWPEFRLVRANAAHPLGAAIDSVGLFLAWPVAVRTVGAEGVETFVVSQIDASDQVWGESQWLDFRAVPRAQRAGVRNPPRPDAGRDSTEGPWPVVVGAERFLEGAAAAQRVLVVGSHGWFMDQITRESQVVDGREAPLHPANAELFDAGVAWLAGQDALIAPSPRARRIARIQGVTDEQLVPLRWALVLGLPVCVLLLGATIRLLRG
ncbi:MAG: hypothetical protein EA379_03680 [Phycisphaerales bacterium]|nr:MAG: hypothetical protein EA379_03680 [Phycisphaerales bacterium]